MVELWALGLTDTGAHARYTLTKEVTFFCTDPALRKQIDQFEGNNSVQKKMNFLGPVTSSEAKSTVGWTDGLTHTWTGGQTSGAPQNMWR